MQLLFPSDFASVWMSGPLPSFILLPLMGHISPLTVQYLHWETVRVRVGENTPARGWFPLPPRTDTVRESLGESGRTFNGAFSIALL